MKIQKDKSDKVKTEKRKTFLCLDPNSLLTTKQPNDQPTEPYLQIITAHLKLDDYIVLKNGILLKCLSLALYCSENGYG